MWVVLSRGHASGGRGGGVKALRLRGDVAARREDAMSYAKVLMERENCLAWIAQCFMLLECEDGTCTVED